MALLYYFKNLLWGGGRGWRGRVIPSSTSTAPQGPQQISIKQRPLTSPPSRTQLGKNITDSGLDFSVSVHCSAFEVFHNFPFSLCCLHERKEDRDRRRSQQGPHSSSRKGELFRFVNCSWKKKSWWIGRDMNMAQKWKRKKKLHFFKGKLI